jgi:hypothetical protein
MDRCYEIFFPFWFAYVLVICAAGSCCYVDAADVRFDVVPVVGCRDVTSAEFAAVNPHERLCEARFQLSSLIPRGGEDELVQYLYRIESPHRGFVVVDYLPQTTLATDVVKHLSVEKHRETHHDLGISVSGQYNKLAQGAASASNGKSIKSHVRYELLPPLELLASSGTISRGSGVYFKLRPSRRNSLEGAKEFVLVLRVPREWRGDYVQVRCEAVGRQTHLLPTIESEKVWGAADFLVALYAEGDVEAQQIASSFAVAEQALRETVDLAEKDIRKLAYPNLSMKLGRLPKFVEPKWSPGRVERFLNYPEQFDASYTPPYLPRDVRQALTTYATAKQQLHALRGEQTVLASSTLAGAE